VTGPTGAQSITTGPTGHTGATGMTGPSGPSFPVTDAVFKVINSVDPTESVMFNLNGQSPQAAVQLCFTGGVVGVSSPNIFFKVPIGASPPYQETVVYETYTGTIYNKFYSEPLLIHPRGYSSPSPTALATSVFVGAVMTADSSDSAGVVSSGIATGTVGGNVLGIQYGTPYTTPPSSITVTPVIHWTTYMNSYFVNSGWGVGQFSIQCDLTGIGIPSPIPLFSYMVM
jgi:hypothetical protein